MTRDLDHDRILQRTDRALLEYLAPATIARRVPLDSATWSSPGEPVSFAVAASGSYTPIDPGTTWGPAWSTVWFRMTGFVPLDWPASAVEADVDLGFETGWPGFQAEGLAYDLSGRILKGIEPLNTHVRLASSPGDAVEFLVEAAANPDILRRETFSPTPLGDPRTAGDEPLYTFAGASLVQRDPDVRALADDTRILRDLLDVLPADRPRAARIRRALYDMLDLLDPHRVAATAVAARAALAEVLVQPAAASAHRVDAVGHAHIDSAWLWPIRETIRKCARTFSNVLDLMDEDPDLVFACSSAQQYAWMEEHYPQLHERIAARIAEGRWIATGGMWVESDTMMPGGESLVRQFVEGTAYFRDAFGVKPSGVWLPDSFGYSAAMPQIARAAGADWFLTQKLSWNDTNRMPHHTFSWRGIDGTRIFTHFPPSDTYSARVTVAELDLAERQFTEHASSSRSLLLFGHGDGGGGPTRSMMESARRAADLEGLPRVRVVSPDVFFAEAEAEQPDAATWTGELYLELHRGTLTSQARTKAGNRRNERLLLAAELWCATATVRTGRPYPADELRAAWRTVLLLQFHDILPGSSIGWVHQQAEASHAEVTRTLEAIIADALGALVDDGPEALLANPGGFAVDGVEAASIGAGSPTRAAAPRRESGDLTLEDARTRIRFTEEGTIDSFVDLASGRDLVPPGARFGALRLHPDHPARWDAWDIDRPALESAQSLGPPTSLVASNDTITIRWSSGTSTFRQDWQLVDGIVRLRILVDWHDRGRLLKLGLPLDVRADTYATETQFGHVTRTAHRNTSWEEARYEVCQHRWLHVGEPGFGVAIANDRSYGVSVSGPFGIDVGVSLLRGTGFPDPASDLGTHEYRFALQAGADLRDAVRLGRELDTVVSTVSGGSDAPPLVSLESEALVREAVLLAHDGSGDVIVRVSEFLGSRARGILRTTFDWTDVTVTDLHEQDLAEESPLRDGVHIEADASTGTVSIESRPFALITLRFRR